MRLRSAAVPALLPATASAGPAHPDPLPRTGQQIVHDPTVHRLKDGRYAARGVLGARLRTDPRHRTDAGDAFTTPPARRYDCDATADPRAPDPAYRDGRHRLRHAVSSRDADHSAIGVATSPTGLPGTRTEHGRAFTSERTDTWNAIDPAVIRADGRPRPAFGSYRTGIRTTGPDPATGKALPGAPARHPATRPDAPYAVTGPYTDSTGTPMPDGGGDLLPAGHGRRADPGGASVSRTHGKTWPAHHHYDATDDGTPEPGLDEPRWHAGRPVPEQSGRNP
ncbi:arabinan endo-1,5-alpha-L-arabinosidase [Streptomyces eurythermus]